jgi:hypothetical protein
MFLFSRAIVNKYKFIELEFSLLKINLERQHIINER